MLINNYIEWFRVKAIMSIRLRKDFASLIQTIDTKQLQALQEKYKSDTRYYKYLNVNKYLKVALRRVYTLNLHQSKPLRILDIGTGTGYFPYACNYFKHYTEAIDKDEVSIFNEVTELLKINRKAWEVKAFEKLPYFENRFDLVTAFRVVFNNDWDLKKKWAEEEWAFFLGDLAENVSSDHGRAYLDLNIEQDQHYDERLQNFFTQYGARVNGSIVYFPSMENFRPAAPTLGASKA